MKVLGLIPARGGSKGIPRKNIRLLEGRPLIAYSAQTALAVRALNRVILSTEDPEIARIGRECGLDVPFLRPADLAQDHTPTLPVVRHALESLIELGESYDAVCLLQPTNPFRTIAEIEGCLGLWESRGADTVFTVRPVPLEYNPHWVYFESADGDLRLSTGEPEPIPRRQSLPPAYYRDGSVYVIRTSVVLEGDSLYGERIMGYRATSPHPINLDTMADWARAESIAAEWKGS